MTQITITTSGPFFRLGAGPVLDSLHDAVRELVAQGETLAKDRAIEVVYSKGGAHPEQYRPTGRWLNSLHGEMTGNLSGTIDDSRLVYGNWLEGTGSRNAKSRFKGYATFRHVAGELDKRAGGVLEKHVRRAVGKLD
jgi:hypothetical protein